MAGSPRPPGAEEDGPTPAWVYAGGLLLIVVAVAFVAMHLAGGVPTH